MQRGEDGRGALRHKLSRAILRRRGENDHRSDEQSNDVESTYGKFVVSHRTIQFASIIHVFRY